MIVGTAGVSKTISAEGLKRQETCPAIPNPQPASRRQLQNLQQIGGTAPDTLRQLAQGSDVIVTMLPTSAIVEHVLHGGDDNLFAGLRPGTVIIEMSSGVPSVTQRLAEKVAASGAEHQARRAATALYDAASAQPGGEGACERRP
jgi:hypothetical protein